MTLEFFKKYLFSPRAGAVVRKISWLTVIALSLSISALIVVYSVMTALNRNIEDRTLAVEPHLSIEIPGVNQGILLEAHPLTTKVRDLPEVRKVDVFETQDVILRTMEGHFQGAIARGQTDDSINEMLKGLHQLNANTKGEPYLPEMLGPDEVLIGYELAKRLGLFEGDQLMVVPPESLLLPPTETPQFARVTVKRILETNLADVDGRNIFYSRDLALKSLKSTVSRRTYVEVYVKDPQGVDSLKSDLKAFPEARMETWKERNSALFYALRLEKIAISLFLSLAALIASFSMISVLALLISQKRREIGMLLALGLSKRKTQHLFRNIGLCLSGLGLGVGVIVGSGISYYLELYPLQGILPDIYYDPEIPAYLEGRMVLLLVFLGAGLSFLGSSWMSSQASQESPSEALRQKI